MKEEGREEEGEEEHRCIYRREGWERSFGLVVRVWTSTG